MYALFIQPRDKRRLIEQEKISFLKEKKNLKQKRK